MSIVGNGYQTGTADPGFYQNALKKLLTDPTSFSGTPGYQFALNQGLDAVNRSNSAIRNSGNALIALQDRGAGLASQNYGQYLSQLGQLGGQEQNYDLGLAGANNTAQANANQLALGQEQNANQLSLGNAANFNNATRNANDLTLGNAANANNAQRNMFDYRLGSDQNANNAQRNAFDYNLGQGQLGLGFFNGANNYNLGAQQNANQAQNNWWNYSLGNSQNQNNFNLGQQRNATDFYNAQTNRGSARSNDYYRGQQNQRDWYSIYPRQVIGGSGGQ